MRISVVATYHSPKGLVTVEALYQLLERIRPEVIFLEIPPDLFPDYRDGRSSNLETTTARHYSFNNDVVLAPVDAPAPAGDFWTNNIELFTRIERVSIDYRRLHDTHIHNVASRGFPYLNSEHSSGALAAIDVEVQESLKWMNDPRLIAVYDEWRRTNTIRELTMLDGIGAYAVHHPFQRAAFLVGAAHRKSMLTRIQADSKSSAPELDWDFADFLVPLGAA